MVRAWVYQGRGDAIPGATVSGWHTALNLTGVGDGMHPVSLSLDSRYWS